MNSGFSSMLSMETRSSANCGTASLTEAARNKIVTLFPAEGHFGGSFYVKHCEFFSSRQWRLSTRR